MRIERDSMGEMEVADDALYGASTARAVKNFPISGHRMPAQFIHALGLVKLACAHANAELGALDLSLAQAIERAAREIIAGEHDASFPVDVFQTGSATSTNTNANEVIANRVSQLAGEALGSKHPVHPNDHVNRGQSSNDVIPTTLHLSVRLSLVRELVPSLRALQAALEEKARAFDGIVKIGRTHGMDATPLSFGQEFSGWAAQAKKAARRIERASETLSELAIGGTAVGTGLNAAPGFGARVAAILTEETGLRFVEAPNHFEAQAGRDDAVEVAGTLISVAAALTKIANDVRLLSTGPRAGLAELRLPETQPGSSIMPGKVNPVMCEMLVQSCLYAHGLSTSAALAGREGMLELNTTLPLLAHTLHEAISVLSRATHVFTERCVVGIEVDEARARELVDRSLMLVTALNPLLGYDVSASIAKEAHATGKTLREVVLARGLLDEATLDRVLDPRAMLGR